MARAAQRFAVIDIIALFGMRVPLINVVGLQIVSVTALLTCVVVSYQYSFAPLFISIETALAIGIVFVLGLIAALFATVRRRMTVALRKVAPAPFANKGRRNSHFRGAFVGACSPALRWALNKRRAANSAGNGAALRAERLLGAVDYEGLAAALTSTGCNESGGDNVDGFPIDMLSTRRTVGTDKVFAVGKWALLQLVWHTSIIPDLYSKRLADIGLEPRLVE